MPNEKLIPYIRSEFAQGVSRDAVVRNLLSAGWEAEDIHAAIADIDAAAPSQSTPAPRHTEYSAPTVSGSGMSTKTLVQNSAAGIFIACVVVLTAISILGVWDIFSGDVITKSFETLGLLAFAAVVVIVASRYVGDPSAATAPVAPQPAFRAIRNITLATLIGSSALLALLGVLAIWDLVSDSSIINRSISSLGIIAFSSLIIVTICFEREQTPTKKKIG
ncbi:MAG: hypothetical protein WCT45_01265 [Candidatus Paceibacterota bacterium]